MKSFVPPSVLVDSESTDSRSFGFGVGDLLLEAELLDELWRCQPGFPFLFVHRLLGNVYILTASARVHGSKLVSQTLLEASYRSVSKTQCLLSMRCWVQECLLQVHSCNQETPEK